MFEDSLITSAVSTDQRRNARRTRWIALTSIVIQGTVLTAFIVVPIIWPETLPLVSITPKMTSLTMKKPEVKVQPKPIPVVTTRDNSYHPPSQPQTMVENRSSGLIRISSSPALAAEEPLLPFGPRMGTGSPLGSGAFGPETSPTPVVVAAAPKNTGPFKISQGVSAGMLLSPIQPVYPRIAIAAHVEGTVVVTAIIDKRGRITGLQVLSGPELLRNAAADAIKEARYRPYLLNGDPTEVVTTISVTFHMGS